MAFRKIEAGLVHAPVDEFIGKTGTIFYDNDLGDFRISDGQTPGGIALSVGGGEGGNYSLPTATTTVKGGVKIDGTTIAITNQVIRVGTVPYSSLSGTPTIPTNNNQLTNGAAYITSSALTGLATESYVTNQGYITSSALTGLASETYVTTRGYITSAALSTYALTSSIPTDINQLADASGLLGQGGGGGGTTYITNNVENPFSFSVAGDDSTLREIANGESIKITGAGGITVTTDAEGNVTVTGTPVSLAGLATESYVNSRGYITGLSFNDLTDKPNLAGTYSWSIAGDDSTLREISAGESVKFVGASGITTASDAEGNITITGPSLAGLATETFVTTQGYITSSALTGLATESYVTSRGYITGLSYNDLTDKPNLAGTYTFNVAADDSTLRTIGTEETVKFVGAGGITTSSDTEGAITITQGTTSSLVNGANTVSLGSDGVLTIPPNGLIIASTGPYGQQHEMRLGDGLVIGQDGGLANYKNVTWSLNGQNSDSGTQIRLPGQADSDNGLSLLIQHQYANSSIDIESYGNIWSFRSDGLLTFPDGTTQSTAPAITIAADDSTQRTIYLGEESIKFVGASGITTASDADGNITITGPSLAGLATETFVTTQGYITGLSYNDLTDKPDLAATYTWSIAADDSTLREILANETVKFIGAGSITTASDAEGNITITGAAQDRLTSNARSAVLNANGTFSLPTLAAEPATPQAGQMALANGTSWDPIAQNNGAPYMVIYTGSAWIGMGGVTVDKVYEMILEMG